MHIYCPKCEAANHELAEICAGCAHRLQPAQPTLAQLADPTDHFPEVRQEVPDPPIADPVPTVDGRSEGEKQHDNLPEEIRAVISGLFWIAVSGCFLLSVPAARDAAIHFAAAFVIPLLALIGYRLGKIARSLEKRD